MSTGKHNPIIRFPSAQIPGKEGLEVGGGESLTIMREFFSMQVNRSDILSIRCSLINYITTREAPGSAQEGAGMKSGAPRQGDMGVSLDSGTCYL